VYLFCVDFWLVFSWLYIFIIFISPSGLFVFGDNIVSRVSNDILGLGGF